MAATRSTLATGINGGDLQTHRGAGHRDTRLHRGRGTVQVPDVDTAAADDSSDSHPSIRGVGEAAAQVLRLRAATVCLTKSMIIAALCLLGLLPLAGGAMVVVKRADQAARDRQRKSYRIFFPSDLTPEQVATFLDGISGSMHRKRSMFGFTETTPSLVFEIWATNRGIEHWLKVPWQYEQVIVPPLLTLVPGTKLVPDDNSPSRTWTQAVEVGAKNSHRRFRISDASALSANILTRFSQLDEGETLMMQWVVSPATPEHKPIHGDARTKEFRWESLIGGSLLATKDEVAERRSKLDEQNFYAVLRVGAVASTKNRATNLVTNIIGAIKSTHGAANHLVDRWWVRDIARRIAIGASPDPLHTPMLLSVSELTALLGWRLGNPLVSGLPPAISRSLPAPESVPREGRVLGLSTFPGRERSLAVPYIEALKHVYLSGGTGSGKTTAMANMIAQDMQNGYGVIVIENKGDLFHQALDYVPRGRINDVIVLDVNDQTWPVGFNILKQGNHAVAVDELNIIFDNLFSSGSMWMQEVLYHSLITLAHAKDGTFMDVRALIDPKEREEEWAHQLRMSVADPEVRDWWVDFERDKKRDEKIAPLKSRLWPIMRSNLINIFGQSKSGFSMADVIKNNKILLINLAGLEDMSAKLAGTIFTNSVWQAVKANPVHKPNFLYIDEFQSFLKLPVDPQDMLAKSRSFGLGMVLANQHLGQLTDDMRDAIMSNAQTKIIFQTGDPTDARRLATSFGRTVTHEDFTVLGRYEALARIATESGTSAPLTLNTLPPMPTVGHSAQVRYKSRGNYGTRVDDVRAEMESRRNVQGTAKKRRSPPQTPGWGI